MPLLSADGIRKQYASIRALDGVSFSLDAGEVHALVGENGAGKSTLIRVLTGAERADAGTLTVGGKPVDLGAFTPARARALGIACVYQQPLLFPDLSVAENIATGLEPTSWWRAIDWRQRDRRARDLLGQVGATFDPSRPASSLSMPEQQLLEIARAIGADARVILMDEPTASLTDREVDHLFALIDRLRSGGTAIVYISHRLDEVFSLADRLTVLRDGVSVASRPLSAMTQGEVVSIMAGRNVSSRVRSERARPGPVALETVGVTSHAAGIRDVTMHVRQGEVLAIAGLVGAGRTEFAETLFGLRRIDQGTIAIDGRAVRITCPEDATRAGLAYVPEDRRRHGVVLELPIAANVSLASLGAISRHGLIDARMERNLAERFVETLRIKAHDVGAATATLSGGNQQKVALARWLARQPSVLILDEPTQGVDVGAKAEIHAVMRDLADRGLALIVISSELPEVLAVADRIAVMRDGRLIETIDRVEATAEQVLALALGHTPKDVAH